MMIIQIIKNTITNILKKIFKKPITAINNTKKKIVKTGFSIALLACISRKFSTILFGEPIKGEMRHRIIEKLFVFGTAVANFGLAIFVVQKGAPLIASLLIINSIAMMFAAIKI